MDPSTTTTTADQHQPTTSTSTGTTAPSQVLPSQLTITDLDPPSISDHHWNQLIPSSLSRRILAAPANTYQTTPLDSGLRRWFFEQMNQDLQIGFDRSQAVNRLRHRMNQIRSSRQATSATTNNRRATNHPTDQPTSTTRAYPSLGSTPSPSSTSQFGSRNLVDILHQVRLQRDSPSRKVNSHYTYLLYCGSTPDQPPSDSSEPNLVPNLNNHHSTIRSRDGSSSSRANVSNRQQQSNNPFGDHRGCGKLITIRATLMTPKLGRAFMYNEVMGDSYSHLSRRSASEHLLLTSDSYPMPDSVDRVDNLTQESFEADPSNFFHRGSSHRILCTCQRTYLGCLSCGNIVGHTVTTLCRQCQEYSTLYPHSYYLNRLTAIPRYVNWPIPLDLKNVKVPDGSSQQKLMSWTQALLRKKSDTDAGYVGPNINNRSQPSTSIVFADGLGSDRPPRLSERVRNAILMGSVDGLLDSAMDIPRSDSRVNPFSSFDTTNTTIDYQTSSTVNLPQVSAFSSLHPTTHRSSTILPNSSNRLSVSTSSNARFDRAALTRRPAVRISSHTRSSSRSLVRSRSRSSSSMSASWLGPWWREVVEDEEDMEAKEGEELMTNRPGNTRRPRMDDDEDRREEEIFSPSVELGTTDPRLNLPNQGSNSNDNRTSNNTRLVRRRIHRNLDHHAPHVDNNSTALLTFSSNFTWSGDVCAR